MLLKTCFINFWARTCSVNSRCLGHILSITFALCRFPVGQNSVQYHRTLSWWPKSTAHHWPEVVISWQWSHLLVDCKLGWIHRVLDKQNRSWFYPCLKRSNNVLLPLASCSSFIRQHDASESTSPNHCIALNVHHPVDTSRFDCFWIKKVYQEKNSITSYMKWNRKSLMLVPESEYTFKPEGVHTLQQNFSQSSKE